MKNGDLLQTLSGCKFYQSYVEAQKCAEPTKTEQPPAAPIAAPKRSRIDRVFKNCCCVLGGMVLFSVLFLIAPLWFCWPPYGKACLLSLPPMILCTLSWMAGAWWAWDKDQRVLMAITLGATPVRILVVLGWAWIVLTIPEVPVVTFVLCLMWHWVLFVIPEVAMLVEFSYGKQIVRVPEKHMLPKAILQHVKRGHDLQISLHAPGRRI